MSGFGKKKKRTRDLSGYSEEELKEYYKNRLLYYLERRKTEKEAARHLRELNCPEELQEELLAFAREYRFIDDEEYARSFIRDAAGLKHHSCRRIRYDLMQKGLSKELIDLVMETEAPSDEEAASALVRKRLSDPEDPEARRKCGNYLQAHGFSYDVIERVLRRSDGENVDIR